MKTRITLTLIVSASISAMTLILFSGSPRQNNRPPVLARIESLTLVDHLDRPFTIENLRGRVHVVNFLFTSCEATCPILVRQMQDVERNTRSHDDRVRFLSISVDPETDTPAVLRTYVSRRHLDTTRWLFLTGPLTSVEQAVVGAFQSTMGKEVHPAEGEKPTLIEITHGENFVVVDAEGRLRGLHKGRTPEDVAAIVDTVERLLEETPTAVVGQR